METNGLSIASLVLGIIGLLFSCLVFGGFLGIIGLVIGIVALCNKKSKHGAAIAGVVCSFIAIIVMIVVLIGGSYSDKKETTVNETNIEEETKQPEESAQKDTATDIMDSENEKPDEEPMQEPAESRDEFISECEEVPYKTLARNPEDYVGKKLKLTVKVSDAINAEWYQGIDTYYKVYTNDEYDMWLGDFYYILDCRDANTETYFKILTDDVITVYGTFEGTVESENHLSGTKSDDLGIRLYYADLISE